MKGNSKIVSLITINELRKIEEKITQEHELEAVLSELKLLRKEFGILCAYETSKEIIIIGDPALQSEISKKAPLLQSKSFRIVSPKEFFGKSTQVLFGFEYYYNLVLEGMQ